MFETGFNVTGVNAEIARGIARAPARQTHYFRKSHAAAACVFMLSLFAPVSIDIVAGDFSVNAAFAGNGDGNYGKGGGNGGSNGQNPGKGGGNGDGDEGTGDDGTGDDGTATIIAPEEPGSGAGDDDAAGMADADLGEAVELANGSSTEGPVAGAMPTVSQIFSLGDESVVSGDAELELIANGWKNAN